MELADPTRRDTRSAILDAAEAVVARMGVGNLTFDEIAREAASARAASSIISAARRRSPRR